ncbi:hypothetical protein BK143_11710 [Paenibacillus peoriae]|uniref:hypothetical protein n=1 Tax=Paenibacillus TaxID=44249 RepID=UPI00096C5098|nr:hypothetical protein [Paenibacillus peoriae]OMF72891.1 hypothetical protein BK143_11710 [Paenibacillus peoriae]
MYKKFEETRIRIKNIDWLNKEEDKPSHAILLFEFYRRRAIFLDHLSISTPVRRAFHSAAKESGIQLPVDIEAICHELELIKDDWLVKWTCLFSLEWAYLIDQKNPVALQFQDMYDPIIELFKRGGRVQYHHADIICGRLGRSRIPSSSLSSYEPKDIRNELLDEMDNAWYYNQISEKNYLLNLTIEEDSAEKIAANLLEQLRDCKATLGDNVIIQTTLGELLLKNKIHAYEQLRIVKTELEQFKMDDLKILLPDAEKEDLYFRIKRVLTSLKEI